MDIDQSQYAKDTVIRLIEEFRLTFGTIFKSYWEATPTTLPPAADFPLVIVQQKSTKAVIGPTSTDDIPETIMVTVMLNAADDAGSSNVRTTTMRKLQYIIQGQDPSTLDYRKDTFLYVLRHYLTTFNTGTQWLIDSDVEITYNQFPMKDLPTICAADIRLTTQRRVVVQNRA